MADGRDIKVCPDFVMVSIPRPVRRILAQASISARRLRPTSSGARSTKAILDISPCGSKTAAEVEQTVRGLQQRIWDELQITVSFGIAAQARSAIASSSANRADLSSCRPDRDAFLAPLSIGKLGNRRKTEATLNARGLKTGRYLAPATTIACDLCNAGVRRRHLSRRR